MRAILERWSHVRLDLKSKALDTAGRVFVNFVVNRQPALRNDIVIGGDKSYIKLSRSPSPTSKAVAGDDRSDAIRSR
jgi:hypothetical protein